MQEKKDDIKTLFAPIVTGKLSDNSAWAAFEGRVKKQNFKSFGFHHFNIYYLVASVVFVMGTSISSYNILKTDSFIETEISSPSSEEETNQKNIENINNQTIVSDSLEKNTNNKSILKISNNTEKAPIQLNNISENNNTPIASNIIKTDTVQKILSIDSTETPLPQKVKAIVTSKKTIIVEEYHDTIREVDTQYVEKKGLFRR